MAGRKRERERDGDFAGTTSSTVCRCKNSRCLKLYCECFRANSYCGDCSCKVECRLAWCLSANARAPVLVRPAARTVIVHGAR